MNNQDLKELKKLVDAAMKDTDDRLRSYPDYGPYLNAKEQLQFITLKIDNVKLINQGDKDSINIGIMAVKSLEDTEPEYARLLMKISTRFKRL